jgi:hypothetical protein
VTIGTAKSASDVTTLHVIVSCKSRKTLPIPASLTMSSLAGSGLEERAADWTQKLEGLPLEERSASALYAGDHWRIVLEIPSSANPEFQIHLWVVSAGYGLIGIDALLKPYSATFIQSHAESVVPKAAAFTERDWWRRISEWSPAPGAPRHVSDLAAGDSNSFVLLALSEAYANALEDDIAAAVSSAPGRVALVSAGRNLRPDDRLASAMLPAEARLKRIVGGAMQGVNARIARKIVSEHARWFPEIEKLRRLIESWGDGVPPLPTYNRARMTDTEVRQFIRDDSVAEPRSSKSRALRRLRDSGQACEQARFGRLFQEVADSQQKEATAP